MKLTDSTGRVIVDDEVEPAGVDSYFSYAVYLDDGSKVPDEELDYLTETCPEYCQEQAFENAVMRAESAYEGER